MADGLDIPTSTDELQAFIEKINELKTMGKFDGLETALKSAKELQRQLNAEYSQMGGGEQAEKLKAKMEIVGEAVKKTKDALGLFRSELDDTEDAAENFNKSLSKVDDTLKNMGIQNHPATSMVRDLFGELRAGGEVLGGTGMLLLGLGNSFTRGMIDPLSSAENQVSAFGKEAVLLNRVLDNFAKVASTAFRGTVAFGGSFADAAPKAKIMADAIATVSADTGISRDKIHEWIQSISDVAPAIDMVGRRVASAGGSIEYYSQQILLAKANGMTQNDVQRLAAEQFQNFNEKASATNKNLAMFGTLARETDRPVKSIMDQMMGASKSFGIFGRQLGETASMWKAFADGMKGLPIAEVGKLFETVSGNIANMKLETQAFVAQMSGMARGATALGGAIQMELEMRRPGGAQRNLERVMQSITRMTGGQVITLEEAGRNPALEMQFQMQRQLAGQMLGVQGGAQQSRLLEVLQGVQRGGMTEVDAMKNISKLTDEGRKVQEQSVPLLNGIMNSTSRIPGIAQSVQEIAAAGRARVAAMGRAAAVPAAGATVHPKEARMMGRYPAEAAEGFAADFKRIMPEIFRDTTAHVRAVTTGIRSLGLKKEWQASQAATTRPQEQLVATMLPPAAPGMFAPRAARRTERETGLPPMFFHREPLPRPPEIAEVLGAPERRGPALGRAAPAAGGSAGAQKALTATPLEAPSVEIKVVCEKCLRKMMQETVRGGNRQEKGDHDHF